MSTSRLRSAETTRRVCLGIELNPAYVDVAVERWRRFTGKSAVLESSGESFDYLAERYRTTRSASSASVTVPVLSLSLDTPMPSSGPGSRP